MLLGLDDGDFNEIEAARKLQALAPCGVIVKIGERGAVVLQPGGDPVALPTHHVEAVDTTAAGDAFNGAFAVALAEGMDAIAAARFAIAASAIAVTRPGAQPSMALRDEIDRFLAERIDLAEPGNELLTSSHK